MAEGLLCFTRLDDPHATILHSQGRPLSPLDEIRIVDQDENDVAPGETGQLLTRGPLYHFGLLPRPCPQRAGLYRARVLPHRRQCQAG